MSFSPIAIVGRACVLPQALTPEALWDAVVQGRDLLSNAPAGAGGFARARSSRTTRETRTIARGRIAAATCRASRRCSIRPGSRDCRPTRSAALDPLFQWVLHTARASLRDARVAGGAAGRRRVRKPRLPVEGARPVRGAHVARERSPRPSRGRHPTRGTASPRECRRRSSARRSSSGDRAWRSMPRARRVSTR